MADVYQILLRHKLVVLQISQRLLQQPQSQLRW
jgi:hypothetical protein